MGWSDARNEAGANKGGKNTDPDHSKSQKDKAEAGNKAAMGGGAKQSGMSDAAAMHNIYAGRISTPSIPAGGVATGNFPTQDDAGAAYSKAVGSHATRGTLGRIMDAILGGLYDENEPMAGNPRSFAGGNWHSSSNPGGVIGGLLGGMVPGLGLATGPIASRAYTGLGLPDVWHGGLDQPDMRNGLMGNTDNPMGGSYADLGGMGGSIFGGSDHTYASNEGPESVNTASGGSSGLGSLGEPNGNNMNRENSGSPGHTTGNPNVVKKPGTKTVADVPDPLGLVQILYDQYYPVNIPNYAGPGNNPTSWNTWDTGTNGQPQMTQNAAPQAPGDLQPAGTFNPARYGRNGGELSFLSDAGTPGKMKTVAELMKMLGIQSAARGGEVKGPGGPKDDEAGLFRLSNKEYVLPVEMIEHFGDGNFKQGIGRLEALRRKVI